VCNGGVSGLYQLVMKLWKSSLYWPAGSFGGSSFTTCFSCSNGFFHASYGNFPVANSIWKTPPATSTIKLQTYRVGQKTGPVWALITQRWLLVKRHVICQVLKCCRQKGPNLHSKSFKYSLPNLPESSLPLKLGICLHSYVPEFTELKNSLPKSPDLNFINYSVWGHCNR